MGLKPSFWNGSMDVPCPWHDGDDPPILVYPDIATTRLGHLGVVEVLAICPSCPTTCWIRPDRDGRPYAIVVMPNRVVTVRRAR